MEKTDKGADVEYKITHRLKNKNQWNNTLIYYIWNIKVFIASKICDCKPMYSQRHIYMYKLNFGLSLPALPFFKSWQMLRDMAQEELRS